ncbi:MAG TPA: prepilin-type N-terminal cleavage/methylation domain-containing protein [bacterium]|nr:prepilin-type N-terminal cleavage/methylation domain-containing protein [bacterium]
MRRRAEATSAERQATGRGFHLIEILVCSAILALLVSLMMPAYLNARNNAAVDEASAMAQEWRTLAYGCHLAHPNDATACLSNTEIGFNESAGKYWNWTPARATYKLIAVPSDEGGTDRALVVSWPSADAGILNGETFIVSMNWNTGQAATACVPVGC